jgi:hypothetical protein
MKLIKMFENHKPPHHKTVAVLFFQSKKIFLPCFVACLMSKLLGEAGGGGWRELSHLCARPLLPGPTLVPEGREARQLLGGWTGMEEAGGLADLNSACLRFSKVELRR